MVYMYTRWTKNARPYLQRVNLHHNTRKKYYMSTSLLKHDIRFTPPWRLNNMLQVSTFEFSCRHCRNSTLGRYSLQLRGNGVIYHDLLRNVLPELLQDVDLQKGIYLCSTRDSAPPHFLIAVQEFLNVFLAECIRREGPIAWPARSPDLNSLDFYPWKHLKSAVYAKEVHHRLATKKDFRRFVGHLEFSSESGNRC
jgi:hypothetical protein